MLQSDKIPIIVGVTGHRNIVDEDKAEIKARVMDSLREIQALCKGDGAAADTPVVMLNAFAQGADMLCAEAAFELGIDVVAVLPCEQERYKESFDNMADKAKLDDYLARAKRKFVAPDIEQNKQWLKDTIDIDDDSYEYRQLGIYMAEHSHILLALWDGKPPKARFGCGTVEVIKFALEQNFLDKDHLFKPGTINDSAVVWIKSRRQGDPQTDIRKQWLISGLESLEEQEEESKEAQGDEQGEGKKEKQPPEYITSDEPPQFLKEIIAKTVKYNNSDVKGPVGAAKLWKKITDLDDYRRAIDYHYAKADELSYGKNQKKYNLFLLMIAIIGTVVACSFLIYDDASLPFMIFPCTIAVGVIIWLCRYGRKKAYHLDYIDYRAFAESLRIQFYMSICLNESDVVTNVGDLYSWAQRIDSVWIDKAIRAIAVICKVGQIKPTVSDVMEAWIGKDDGTGQLKYHTKKKKFNKKQARKYETFSRVFRFAAVAIYFAIFALEILACILKACNIDWFWENNIFAHLSWRNFCAIVLGIFAAGSLLFSSYWGKLSFDRKLEDN